AVAAAGDDERAGALGVGDADMQRRKPAHRQADDMGALELQVIEQRDRVVARMLLRIAAAVLRHLGRRKAARVVGDAAEVAGKEAKLGLPAPVVAGELVDENDGRAVARLLVVQTGRVPRDCMGHAFLLEGTLNRATMTTLTS